MRLSFGCQTISRLSPFCPFCYPFCLWEPNVLFIQFTSPSWYSPTQSYACSPLLFLSHVLIEGFRGAIGAFLAYFRGAELCISRMPRWRVWRICGAFPYKPVPRSTPFPLQLNNPLLIEIAQVPAGRPLGAAHKFLEIRIGDHAVYLEVGNDLHLPFIQTKLYNNLFRQPVPPDGHHPLSPSLFEIGLRIPPSCHMLPTSVAHGPQPKLRIPACPVADRLRIHEACGSPHFRNVVCCTGTMLA
jgi:hypothetical protein